MGTKNPNALAAVRVFDTVSAGLLNRSERTKIAKRVQAGLTTGLTILVWALDPALLAALALALVMEAWP